jgi:hypothetical protein
LNVVNVIKICLIEGNFLRAKSNSNGGSFAIFLNINTPITLPSAGEYTLKLNTFIHCAAQNCNPANDIIIIKIKEDGQSDFNKEIFRTGFENGRIRDKGWILEEIKFETQTNKINVSET